MGIKSNLYVNWIKFLTGMESRIKNLLSKYEDVQRPTDLDPYPLNLNEVVTFEEHDILTHNRLYWMSRLDVLKAQVKKTVKFNESFLTYHQVLELEEIKYNLRTGGK